MNNLILEYLEAYKSLDRLCRQILESDRGVSEYIDEMSNESQGKMLVAGWEKDYKQLKRMRWIRNQLVHDVDSFQDNLISARDVEWLRTFQSRIMERTDPFSLLAESRNARKKAAAKQHNQPKHSSPEKKTTHHWNLANQVMIWLEIVVLGILFVIMFLGIYHLLG